MNAMNKEIPGFLTTERELGVLAEFWAREDKMSDFYSWMFPFSEGEFHPCERMAEIGTFIGEEEVKRAAEKATAELSKETGDDIFWTTFLEGGTLEDITRIPPQGASGYKDRASAYWYLRENEFALADLSQAIGMNPDDADLFSFRGSVLERLGLHEPAIADFLHALHLNPEQPRVHRKLADCHQAMGRLDEAVDDLTTAIRLDPGESYNHYQRGRIFEQMERKEEAHKDYERAMELGLGFDPRKLSHTR